MNDMNDFLDDRHDAGPPPADDLDALLRTWHEENADRAAAGRDRLLRSLAERAGSAPPSLEHESEDPARDPRRDGRRPKTRVHRDRPNGRNTLRRLIMNRYSPAAAAVLVLGTLLALLSPTEQGKARADVLMVPQGGRLDALDAAGRTLGPCPLKHTDVDVEISGRFARVTLVQHFHNPYPDKIEAVYTFPMSHRAAVDRMTMTIGERVVIGEVHERQRARAIYEAAKQRGHVAGLLEQERPNIFTQSVANIEPDVDVQIEISYVELLESADGVFSFAFPMVVGPRYIPGRPTPDAEATPTGLQHRYGLILVAPAELTVGEAGVTDGLGTLDDDRLEMIIASARPIENPDESWWIQSGHGQEPRAWYEFEAVYDGASRELGTLYTNGTGQIGGRWFCFQPQGAPPAGSGYARNTNQVPDASRITPMPTKPPTRAGHDISVTVNIDTGGPGITDIGSALHEIITTEQLVRTDGLPRSVTLQLANAGEIPNRDFILTWREVSDTITESVFVHAGEMGNFFTLILQPPERVTDAQAVPRELIFVLDSSGSMSGMPIEKAKETMAKAMDGLRDDDTFNLITFAGDTHILWDEPRPGTWENIAEAQSFLASREGGGGTEMMKAINAALVKTRHGPLSPGQLANLPADGRTVQIQASPAQIRSQRDEEAGVEATVIEVRPGLTLHAEGLPALEWTEDYCVLVDGVWQTVDGQRVLSVTNYTAVEPQPEPVRIVCFMTDGYVGNDQAIIGAVKDNAHTTRVFAFGIGNSVNRYLLDGMAAAGGGAVDYVPLTEDADAVADRFLQRIQSPVLTDIEIEFSEGLHAADMLPLRVRDLYDHTPIIIHGRYTEPGAGTLTIRGNAGDGPYERVLELAFPERQPEHDTIATLWARAKVEQIMNRNLAAVQEGKFPPELRRQVVELGETFGIMTQFTSFVAVEKLRLTVGGSPRLVSVPIELPDGVSWEGNFGQRLCGWAERICNLKSAPRTPAPAAQGLPSGGRPLDTPANGMQVKSFQLRHASATGVHKQLEALLTRQGQAMRAKGKGDVKPDLFGVFCDPRTNSLIVAGGPLTFKLIDQILAQVDVAPETPVKLTQIEAKIAALDAPGQTQARQEQLIRTRHSEIASREVYRLDRIKGNKKRQITQLMDRAGELRKEQRYDDATEVLKQVLAINPEHDRAAWMKETLFGLAVNRRDQDAVGDRHQQAQDLFVENDESGIPWHKDIMYPENWPDIVATRRGAGDQQVRGKLSKGAQELRVDAQPLGEFIEDLGAAAGVKIQANWTALEAAAIGKDAEVTLHETYLTYGKALDVVLEESGGGEVELGYVIDDGTIKISTKEDLNRKTSIKLYNVAGLQIEVPDLGDVPVLGDIPQVGTAFKSLGSERARQLIIELRGKEEGQVGPWPEDRPAGEAGLPAGVLDHIRERLSGPPADPTIDSDGYADSLIACGFEDEEEIMALIELLEVHQAQREAGREVTAAHLAAAVLDRRVLARLRQAAPEIRFEAAGLGEVLAFLGGLCEVEIVVDWPALGGVGIAKDAAFTRSLQAGETYEGLLGIILDECAAPDAELGYEIDGGVVFVSTRLDIAYRRLMAACAELGCVVNPGAMLAEQVAIHVAALDAEGKAGQARRLAGALVALAPDFKIGRALRDLMSDAPFATAARIERIAGLRAAAAAAIDAFAGRIQRLARRIDERLLPLLVPAGGDGNLPDLPGRDGGVEVSVLTAGKDAAVLAALEAAGLTIDSVAQSANVIVGLAPIGQLDDIALVDAVRRVEPVH